MLRNRAFAAFLSAFVILAGGGTPALAKAPDIPPLTGRVVDQAGILNASQESDLSSKLQALEGKTTIQLVVVTLKSLQSRPIEEWGIALGRGWGIGQAGKNNGVLLIVAPTERELRIEVGYGLEGDLPDATADAIIRNVIVPRFKAGNMVGGISDGVDAIGRVLAGEKLTFSEPQRDAYGDGFQALIPFAFVFLFLLVVTFIQGIRRRSGGDEQSHTGDAGSGWIWGSGAGSDSGSSWSSSSSGGGFSGGGFSGGGGSFGGGGASGKW